MADTSFERRSNKQSPLTHAEMDTNFDSSARVIESVTATRALALSDQNKILECDITSGSITVPTVATITASLATTSWHVTIKNVDPTVLTIDLTTNTQTLDGSGTNLTLAQYETLTIGINAAQTEWIKLQGTNVTSLDNTFTGNNTFSGTVEFSSEVYLSEGTSTASPADNDFDLPGDGNFIPVTGTNALHRMTDKNDGTHMTLEFAASVVIHHNEEAAGSSYSPFDLPDDKDFITEAGDLLEFVYTNTTWKLVNYQGSITGYDSGWTAFAGSETNDFEKTAAHSLTEAPIEGNILLKVVDTSALTNCVVGDIYNVTHETDGASTGLTLLLDSTNVSMRVANGGFDIQQSNGDVTNVNSGTEWADLEYRLIVKRKYFDD